MKKNNFKYIFESLVTGYFISCVLAVPFVVIGFLAIMLQAGLFWSFLIILLTAGTGIYLLFSKSFFSEVEE